MSEQLLKLGLVSEEQVKEAAEKPKKKPFKKTVSNRKKQAKTKSKSRSEKSDLEEFYKLRASEDNREKQEALRKKREAAQRKKEMNKKINKLISENTLNEEDAEIRYNFVVGTTIKYVFVNEKQQQQLAEGQLAITFLGGNKCIIPVKTAKEILVINPKKIVVLSDPTEDLSTSK